MAQAVSRQTLTVETRFQPHSRPCGICDRQSGTGTGVSAYLSLPLSESLRQVHTHTFYLQRCMTLAVDSCGKENTRITLSHSLHSQCQFQHFCSTSGRILDSEISCVYTYQLEGNLCAVVGRRLVVGLCEELLYHQWL